MSILNALATGKGGALSIELATNAQVTVSNGSPETISANMNIGNGRPDMLPRAVVRRTLEHYGHDGSFSSKVETSSNIPMSVGLKSSSAMANAVALATAAAIGEEPREDDLVRIGLDASIESGISITGALDDSYASYHGGAVLTDNEKKIVEKIPEISRNLRVLVLVPGKRKGTVSLDCSKYSSISRISQLAYEEAMRGQVWDALTLNGLAFSSVLGEDPRPALAALRAGALGAGLSGKGPAIAAIATEDTIGRVRRSLAAFTGQVIETRPNFTKASIQA